MWINAFYTLLLMAAKDAVESLGNTPLGVVFTAAGLLPRVIKRALTLRSIQGKDRWRMRWAAFCSQFRWDALTSIGIGAILFLCLTVYQAGRIVFLDHLSKLELIAQKKILEDENSRLLNDNKELVRLQDHQKVMSDLRNSYEAMHPGSPIGDEIKWVNDQMSIKGLPERLRAAPVPKPGAVFGGVVVQNSNKFSVKDTHVSFGSPKKGGKP